MRGFLQAIVLTARDNANTALIVTADDIRLAAVVSL